MITIEQEGVYSLVNSPFNFYVIAIVVKRKQPVTVKVCLRLNKM